MAQFGIPEADAFNGSAPPWIGTCVGGGSVNIYQCIAKAPGLPEDTVIIQSSPVASPNVYVTRLTEVSDPGIH
ncbi:MAG: hypothetical protein ACREJ6_12305, partial [Candidatus Methylomirabilis sp.]